MFKLVPLVFSTCGEYGADLHRIVKDLTIFRPQKYRVIFSDAEDARLTAGDIGAKKLYMTLSWRPVVSHLSMP